MPVLALSLDELKPIAADLWEHMHHGEWWASTAFWGVIWACGFVATFLLLRALFTRYGDRDVMKKTLVVSLLLHVLCGMLSTRVVFGPRAPSQGLLSLILPGSSQQDSPRDDAEDSRFDEVAIEGPESPGDDLAGSEDAKGGRGKLPGESPPWERTPTFDSQTPARLDNQPRGPAAAAIMQPQRAGGGEALSFPSGDQTDRPEHADPFPEPDRQTARLNRPTETPQTPIAEETADARPETGTRTGGEPRASRSAAGEIGAPEITPRARSAVTKNAAPAIDYGPDLAESSKTSDPRPALSPGAETREPVRMSRGSPTSKSTADGAGDETPNAAVAGSGASSGRSAARIGRPSRTPTGNGSLDGPRLGTAGPGGSERPAGSGAGIGSSPGGGTSDGLVASRSAGGDPSGDGLVPSVVRSEIEGAIGKNGGKVPATYRLRTSPARKKIAIDMGANEESERAVETSLQWLADHQHPKGYWAPIESTLGKEPDPKVNFNNAQERERSGFNSESGLTALAVLAFLGKGYTHEDNPFSDTVERALRWLVAQQDSQGFLGGRANPYARMYCHGMATIALGEAYGMTKDNTLREPLERAVQYIVDSQSADGGWRYYKVKQGDMSMFGWQLMALKSARTAGLAVPQAAMTRATDFLIDHGEDMKNRKLSQFGGLAGYRIQEQPKPSMTAESLFCKQMLGIKRTNRAAGEAVEYLLKNLPQRSKQDLYYWYYGTLAMYHHGGEPWRRWNQALRDNLVADQRTDGEFAGSWNPRAPWGDYGGRVFSTALSTLCLEVYYRFLPLYQSEGSDRLDQSAGR
jgi:hypothetical protein